MDGFSDLTELAFGWGQTGTNSKVYNISGGDKCSGESRVMVMMSERYHLRRDP